MDKTKLGGGGGDFVIKSLKAINKKKATCKLFLNKAASSKSSSFSIELTSTLTHSNF